MSRGITASRVGAPATQISRRAPSPQGRRRLTCGSSRRRHQRRRVGRVFFSLVIFEFCGPLAAASSSYSGAMTTARPLSRWAAEHPESPTAFPKKPNHPHPPTFASRCRCSAPGGLHACPQIPSHLFNPSIQRLQTRNMTQTRHAPSSLSTNKPQPVPVVDVLSPSTRTRFNFYCSASEVLLPRPEVARSTSEPYSGSRPLLEKGRFLHRGIASTINATSRPTLATLRGGSFRRGGGCVRRGIR